MVWREVGKRDREGIENDRSQVADERGRTVEKEKKLEIGKERSVSGT